MFDTHIMSMPFGAFCAADFELRPHAPLNVGLGASPAAYGLVIAPLGRNVGAFSTVDAEVVFALSARGDLA